MGSVFVGGHKFQAGRCLFMFPVTVTTPAAAKSNPKFDFLEEALSLKFDPATKAELTIRVLASDEPAQRPTDGTGAIGECKIEITDKPQQQWVPLASRPEPQNRSRSASPAWDPLLPIPLPKDLNEPLPTLFPETATERLVLTYTAGKLVLRLTFPLAENPEERLLARYWRGGNPDFSETRLLRFERLSRSADHEYTMVVAGGPGLSGSDKVGVQLLYSELGWKMVDPNVFADVVSANTAPLPPVISNRVDFIADGEEKAPGATSVPRTRLR